jgi:hydrogenase expression/formation protein HypD
MEVCGSHTMAIARYGIRDILPDGIRLVSGPGCPVCVTDAGYIDTAVELARRGVVIATFGDMLHVPGSETDLASCRAEGNTVEVCYGPAAALEYARAHPDREVVFLAIGFETTIPPVVSLTDRARELGIRNLSLLTAFKTIPPAMRALLADPELAIDAFLCPAHVSAIIGAEAYEPFTGNSGVPCVVAGFEPLDILMGVEGILGQLGDGVACVENQYARVVRPKGNRKAQALMRECLTPVTASWRGLGKLPDSGLRLRESRTEYDAETRHGVTVGPGRDAPGCLCGDVIKGKCRPPDCPLFATACHPDSPVGPCMVSSEGSCAAEYRYARLETTSAGGPGAK